MNYISPINYDMIAPKYDKRYEQNPLAGVSRELRTLVAQTQARDVLEVGCGTGIGLSNFYLSFGASSVLTFRLGCWNRPKRRTTDCC